MLTYDPTPATWMWAWDNDVREDARPGRQPGLQSCAAPHDRRRGPLHLGRTDDVYAFPGAHAGRGDLWEVTLPHRQPLRPVDAHDQPPLLRHRRAQRRRRAPGPPLRRRTAGSPGPSVALAGHAKVNDCGPYDYHRDFNLTYPLQLMADVSYTLGTPRWFGLPQTQLGVRGTCRTLDRYSNRYQPGAATPEPADPRASSEWEIRTYLHLALSAGDPRPTWHAGRSGPGDRGRRVRGASRRPGPSPRAWSGERRVRLVGRADASGRRPPRSGG